MKAKNAHNKVVESTQNAPELDRKGERKSDGGKKFSGKKFNKGERKGK